RQNALPLMPTKTTDDSIDISSGGKLMFGVTFSNQQSVDSLTDFRSCPINLICATLRKSATRNFSILAIFGNFRDFGNFLICVHPRKSAIRAFLKFWHSLPIFGEFWQFLLTPNTFDPASGTESPQQCA